MSLVQQFIEQADQSKAESDWEGAFSLLEQALMKHPDSWKVWITTYWLEMRVLSSKWIYLLCPLLGLGLTAATVFIVIMDMPIVIGKAYPHGFPIPWLATSTQTIYWFAFTIDTICWSSLVLVPLHMLRRVALDSASARARLLGLCPKCSYDLRASPGPHCPECDHPIPIKTVQNLRC